jgi:hypothetical protein
MSHYSQSIDCSMRLRNPKGFMGTRLPSQDIASRKMKLPLSIYNLPKRVNAANVEIKLKYPSANYTHLKTDERPSIFL